MREMREWYAGAWRATEVKRAKERERKGKGKGCRTILDIGDKGRAEKDDA